MGIPIIVAKEKVVKQRLKEIGYNENLNIEIVNSTIKEKREKYTKYLFKKLHREQGLLERDCDRMVRNDRVIWSLVWLHVVMLMQWLQEILEDIQPL